MFAWTIGVRRTGLEDALRVLRPTPVEGRYSLVQVSPRGVEHEARRPGGSTLDRAG
jgi:hypothetical protein